MRLMNYSSAFALALKSTEVQFDYGADKVCIAVPLRRHYLF